jgi:hypothetical protein
MSIFKEKVAPRGESCEGARTSALKSLVRQAVAFFAIGHQGMVARCRCLKENVDALRIESVPYGRVTGYREVICRIPTS